MNNNTGLRGSVTKSRVGESDRFFYANNESGCDPTQNFPSTSGSRVIYS